MAQTSGDFVIFFLSLFFFFILSPSSSLLLILELEFFSPLLFISHHNLLEVLRSHFYLSCPDPPLSFSLEKFSSSLFLPMKYSRKRMRERGGRDSERERESSLPSVTQTHTLTQIMGSVDYNFASILRGRKRKKEGEKERERESTRLVSHTLTDTRFPIILSSVHFIRRI